MTIYDASLDYLTDSESKVVKTVAVQSETIASKEHTKRNHFLRFLLINILVWPLLTFIGLQVSQSHSPAVSKSLLKTSGAQAMTAEELTAIVQAQGRPIFWLGRLSGDTYSENSTVSGVDVITYFPENATPQSQSRLDFVIRTYGNSKIFNVQLHPLSGTADKTVENVGGITVIYNPASPDHSVITFKNRPQVIAMAYPEFQKISTLIADAQNLIPIQ